MTCLSFSPKSQLLDSQPLSRLACALSSLSEPLWSSRTKTLERGHLSEAAPHMTSNLESQTEILLGTSGDRLGPGLTELLGTGWGPGQAQEPLPSRQAVTTACSDFWTLLGASFLGRVNQALQNATHLDRMGKSLRGGHCGVGVKGQPGLSLLRVPVPSQVSSKTFTRAKL